MINTDEFFATFRELIAKANEGDKEAIQKSALIATYTSVLITNLKQQVKDVSALSWEARKSLKAFYRLKGLIAQLKDFVGPLGGCEDEG